MRGTTFAAVVLLFGVQTEAGTITQTVGFQLEGPGANFAVYNQFDPSLGPLNAVFTSVTLFGTSTEFLLENRSINTNTFNASIIGEVHTSDGVEVYSNYYTVPITLGPEPSPEQSTYVDSVNMPGPPGYQASLVSTTNLSSYIGTGKIFSFIEVDSNVSVDNNMIQIVASNDPSDVNDNIRGTETVQYFYGTTFFTPEPSSVVMMTLGLAAVAALAGRRRFAA